MPHPPVACNLDVFVGNGSGTPLYHKGKTGIWGQGSQNIIQGKAEESSLMRIDGSVCKTFGETFPVCPQELAVLWESQLNSHLMLGYYSECKSFLRKNTVLLDCKGQLLQKLLANLSSSRHSPPA
ncbi:hypothetical protein P7K49_033677 [Saguinus oedipus]|uniref:Uncharacterized protein n=1 Tax=Saguinus oedipus TaxID=9490 RepID=A0ABQ9TSK6_SAGOE|nr:hypothetical protein P7K49_033677 [Saguinus oedipus]